MQEISSKLNGMFGVFSLLNKLQKANNLTNNLKSMAECLKLENRQPVLNTKVNTRILDRLNKCFLNCTRLTNSRYIIYTTPLYKVDNLLLLNWITPLWLLETSFTITFCSQNFFRSLIPWSFKIGSLTTC